MKLLISIVILIASFTLLRAQNDTTTAAPNSTTSFIDTTTDNVTATTENANATTESFNVTTLPMTTPSPSPTEPPPTLWNVTGSDGKTCILAEFDIVFEITYMLNNSTEDSTADVRLPQNADFSDSTCAGNTSSISTLNLQFYDGWAVAMNFTLGSTDDDLDDSKYYMTSFSLKYVFDEHFTNPSNPGTTATAIRTENDFGTSLGKSYKCESASDLELSEDVTIEITDFQIQVFAGEGGAEFGDTVECVADVVSNNLVAIIVGCCLAGLIIIVAIGYCAGRYRKKKAYAEI